MADNPDQQNKKESAAPGQSGEAPKSKDKTKDGKDRSCSDSKDSSGHCLPPPELTSFMMSLTSTALMQLGEIPDPINGEVVFDLVMAKHSIDIIAMLQEKLRNGLTEDEDKLIEGLLYELRLRYVQKS